MLRHRRPPIQKMHGVSLHCTPASLARRATCTTATRWWTWPRQTCRPGRSWHRWAPTGGRPQLALPPPAEHGPASTASCCRAGGGPSVRAVPGGCAVRALRLVPARGAAGPLRRAGGAAGAQRQARGARLPADHGGWRRGRGPAPSSACRALLGQHGAEAAAPGAPAQVVRAVEEMAAAALGPERVRAWLLQVAAGRELEGCQLASVEGYQECALATEVGVACSGPGAAPPRCRPGRALTPVRLPCARCGSWWTARWASRAHGAGCWPRRAPAACCPPAGSTR
jgi:hypothetical protein